MEARVLDRSVAGASVLMRSRVAAGCRILVGPYKRHFGMISAGLPAGGRLMIGNPRGDGASPRGLLGHARTVMKPHEPEGQKSAVVSRDSRSAPSVRLTLTKPGSSADGNFGQGALEGGQAGSVSPRLDPGGRALFGPSHQVPLGRMQAVEPRPLANASVMPQVPLSARSGHPPPFAMVPIYAPTIEMSPTSPWPIPAEPAGPAASATMSAYPLMQRLTARSSVMRPAVDGSWRSAGSVNLSLRSVAPESSRAHPTVRDTDDPMRGEGADTTNGGDEDNTMEGELYLDGQALGRWIARHLGRVANGPAMGVNAVDVRSIAMWPGSTF